jgi:hypothetical protein
MDKCFRMDILNSFHHLVAYHQGGLEIELLASEVKQILQRLSTQVHDHNIVLALTSHIIDIRKAVIG